MLTSPSCKRAIPQRARFPQAALRRHERQPTTGEVRRDRDKATVYTGAVNRPPWPSTAHAWRDFCCRGSRKKRPCPQNQRQSGESRCKWDGCPECKALDEAHTAAFERFRQSDAFRTLPDMATPEHRERESKKAIEEIEAKWSAHIKQCTHPDLPIFKDTVPFASNCQDIINVPSSSDNSYTRMAS